MGKFYLTTAIDYSNGDPHVGHALEKVGADAIARYRRLRGDRVHYVMGMDEHSQSVIQAAASAGVSPRQWVDQMAQRFERFWQRLECSNDDWIRTTEPRHQAGVTALLERIRRHHPDDLFQGEYEGLYCTGCEEFKTDTQIVNGRCAEHPTLDLVPTKERNWFFRLSRYGERMHRLISSGEFRVEPEIRRNEVLRLIEMGLQDISISRQRMPWGIPFPGDPEQTVYVWFDALINYLSATGFPAEGWQRLWPADLHIIGKGITRFHCVIWPSMLEAADLPLPKQVWAHGYVQWAGAKMSKTAGTAVTLDSAIERHGVDPLRYFLLREIGFESDGDFTWERFDARYTADLADGLGNLASRSLAMLDRYRQGVVPAIDRSTPLDQGGQQVLERYAEAMDRYDLRNGADAAWSLVATANQYIVQTEPWKLAKSEQQNELDAVLAALARCLYRLTVMVAPFMPGKSTELWSALGQTGTVHGADWSTTAAPPVSGRQTSKPAVLFPKPPTPPPVAD